MLKFRPGEALNPDGQTFGIRSWYGNYIAVINFVCVVSFKRFPFYVRSYDALELRNALEYARRMVRLLFDVELRALHSDVFSSYYNYSVIAEWRALNNSIGARIGGRVLTYDGTLRFWFAAHWQAVTLLDIRPNEGLKQMHGHPVAPTQRTTGDYSPINVISLHMFGARCFRFVEPGSRKSQLKVTAEAGYYLRPATYCPFIRVLVSAPRLSVLITTRGPSYMQTRSNSPTRTRLVRPASRSNGMRANRRPNSFPLWRGGWGALSPKVAWANHAASVAYVR